MSIVTHPANAAFRSGWDLAFGKNEELAVAHDIPRRNRMEAWTSVERAIHSAAQAVEAMPADIRLTEAGILLGRAQSKVADFIDGFGRCAVPNCTAQPLPNKSVCSDHV